MNEPVPNNYDPNTVKYAKILFPDVDSVWEMVFQNAESRSMWLNEISTINVNFFSSGKLVNIDVPSSEV